MMDNNLFCDQQHGFVPGRSCMTQLLVTLELWTELLDSGASIDVIYLDFKKAFDTVPHQRLLRKLKAYGITGKVLEWIRDFFIWTKAESSSKWKAVSMDIYPERNTPRKRVRSDPVRHFHK
jgi:hypothetical protein